MAEQIDGAERIHGSTHWGTHDEIEYVRKIGENFPKNHIGTKFTKKQLVQKYLTAMQKKVNWGNINKKEVLYYATELLNTL
ncbi:MAG: hypothetical protein WC440_02720 [Candidatus Omnitrophota bacterium]|jgi:hypothetical protein